MGETDFRSASDPFAIHAVDPDGRLVCDLEWRLGPQWVGPLPARPIPFLAVPYQLQCPTCQRLVIGFDMDSFVFLTSPGLNEDGEEALIRRMPPVCGATIAAPI